MGYEIGKKKMYARVLNYIKDHQPVDSSKMLANLSIETGMKLSTLEGYLEVLATAGHIKRNADSKLVIVGGDHA